MNNLQKMTDEEIEYICSLISPEKIKSFLKQGYQRNRKLKQKLKNKISNSEDLMGYLLEHYSDKDISLFLERSIDEQLKQVERRYNDFIDKGESKEEAYIHAFAGNFFNENIALYFKLKNKKEFSEESIRIIDAAAQLCRQSDKALSEEMEKNKELEKDMKNLQGATQNDISGLENENGQLKADIEACNEKIKKLEEFERKYNAAQEKQTELQGKVDSLNTDIKDLRQDIKTERENVRARERDIERLEKEKEDLKQDNNSLNELLEEQAKIKPGTPKTALQPADMEEFMGCLDDNFDSIGLIKGSTEKNMLLEYLGHILFKGMPIITNQVVAHTIAACVSNTLYASKTPDVIQYKEGLSAADIQNTLEHSGRVVCMDGFLGNDNEITLLPVIVQFCDKIIFLTVTSEATVAYLDEGIMLNCIYFNANRIGALARTALTSADPSTIEEEAVKKDNFEIDDRANKIIAKIAEECQLPLGLANKWRADASSNDRLCQILFFSLLPYCRYVLKYNPYKMSPRLEKYTKQSGCADILRWFEK